MGEVDGRMEGRGGCSGGNGSGGCSGSGGISISSFCSFFLIYVINFLKGGGMCGGRDGGRVLGSGCDSFA